MWGRAQTFAQADTAGDGIISPAEWLELVRANPSIIDYMTLPVLKEVTRRPLAPMLWLQGQRAHSCPHAVLWLMSPYLCMHAGCG